MSHVVFVERVFVTRSQAESYFESLRPMAWPYAWCTEDVQRNCWKVTALVEEGELREVSRAAASGPRN